MDRSWAQAFWGGLTSTPNSLILLGRYVTRREIKSAAHGQKIPPFFPFQVAPSQPPQATIPMSTKLGPVETAPSC